MDKEEAIEEYRKRTELLTTERTPGVEATMPVVSVGEELAQMAAALKNKKGTFRKDASVEKALTDASMLVLALTVPTQVVWREPTGETERDPVSGNPLPKMAWRREGTPLSEAEVRRAVDKAMKLLARQRPAAGLAPRAGRKRRLTRKGIGSGLWRSGAERPAANGTYSFAREMIALGGGEASSADLVALSEQPIPMEPWVQAVWFLMMLEEPDSGLFFTGSPKMRRTREHLSDLCDLQVAIMADPDAIPTHILPNDLTGESVANEKGEASYAREGCVKHARHAVVEFDEMPLREQAAFWKGVIVSGLLPLRALVYSGGKSIHGLLRLDDTKDFKEQWKVLERNLASDADVRYRCDLAFRSPVQMMRFPGARRPETHRLQALLYIFGSFG